MTSSTRQDLDVPNETRSVCLASLSDYKRKKGEGCGDGGGGLWIVLATKHIGLSHKENKIPSGNLAVNG